MCKKSLRSIFALRSDVVCTKAYKPANIENCFRSAKIERSATERFFALNFLKYEICAKNRCALFLHSGNSGIKRTVLSGCRLAYRTRKECETMKRNVMVMVAVALAAACFPMICFADKTLNILYSGDLRGNITPIRG